MQRGGLRGGAREDAGRQPPFLRKLHAIEKPVIAAVRGPTVGIGWSIALACDLIVASETARFSQVFRRIGLAPDGGAIWFLTRRMAWRAPRNWCSPRRFVEAPEALALGLVNYVVPDGELMAKTEELAADLAAGPTFAFGMAKKLFHMASGRATRTSSTWKLRAAAARTRPRTIAKASPHSRKSGSRISSGDSSVPHCHCEERSGTAIPCPNEQEIASLGSQ